MSEQLQVTFRHMPTSDALSQLAAEKFQKLRSHYPDARDCHVVIDCPAATHHRKGPVFGVHAEVTLVRNHTRVAGVASHEDAYVAMREAFEHLRRQLEHRAERTG